MVKYSKAEMYKTNTTSHTTVCGLDVLVMLATYTFVI